MSEKQKLSAEEQDYVKAVYAELDVIVRRHFAGLKLHDVRSSLVLYALTSMAGTLLGCFPPAGRPVARDWCLQGLDEMARLTAATYWKDQ